MEKMKAVVYHKNGKPDQLIYSDVEKPKPSDDEVLIKIIASSVNAADYRSMKMGIIPKGRIFGADIAGKIKSVGRNIRQFKAGDEVIGELSNVGFGGFAQYVVAPENVLVLKPAGLSFEEAADLPLAAVTALQSLHNKGNLQKGQKVLIVGSSGGVGTFTLQLAKHFGAKVTAVCSTRNEEQTKMLGADFIVDYTKQDFTKGNQYYDLIIAVNGNYPLSAYKRLLNKNGIYVMVGGAMTQIIKSLLLGRLMSFGSKKMLTLSAKSNQKNLELIVKLAAEGKIRPVIESQYSLDKASEAMKYLSKGHVRGKVVITVEGNL